MARFLVSILFSILISILLGASFALSAETRNLEKLFKKEKIVVGDRKIDAWIADDDVRREQGLMFIESMPAETGMLFVFEAPQTLNFWMKNTVIPLAIGFFDENGVLVDIQEMRAANSLMDLKPPTYQSLAPAVFALEMNTGWFARHKIKVGALIKPLGAVSSPLLKKKLKSRGKPRR